MVTLLLAGATFAAQAQSATDVPPVTPTAETPAELPTMVVTATRTEEDPFTLPYSVSAVTPAEFERKMPRTTPEALRELPSIMLQKTAHGQGSPYLRGFTGFRTLMLVDGIRLNNSTFRDGPNQYWNTVDALSLDRLEVVRGPGSVLYGSDAIGGTVNALSKGRRGYESGFDANGSAFYRYSSAEQSHMGRPEFSGQYDHKVGFHVGASLKDFGDLRGGEEVGKQPETGYSEWDLDAKVEYFVAPNSRLVYGHQTVRLNDAWRTHSTIYGVLWSGTTRGSDRERFFDQARDLDYLQYHAEKLEGFADELHVSVSRHYQGESEDRIRSNRNREVQDVDVETLGLSLQLQSPSKVGRWIYGAEYYHDWVNSAYRGYNAAGDLTTVRVQGPVADDAGYDLVGAYVENHLPIVADTLALILGGRYTYAAADAKQVQDPYTGLPMSLADSWDTLVGNARLSYQPGDPKHWTLYAGVAQGFRAPNLSDLTRFDIARSGEQEIPAFGLEPESFLSPEVGVKMEYGRLAAEAAYFYTFQDDLIVRVPTGQTTANGDLIVNKENSGEGYVHGVELAASARLHRDWTLWANFTWMRGELDTPIVAGGEEVTEPVSRLMPTTVNSGLRWHEVKGRLWAEFATTFAEKQDRLASNDVRDTQRIPVGGTPGYGVFNLRAGWNFCRHATLTAALENLTDEDYRIHGSGANEPGRNFVLTAEMRF
ncbi:MAG: TonB-dependent receptor [Verrucomicrobiales bacterium]|nr:TonB-dependent receptor [Verrucomicrobiales bacterium]